MDEIPITQHSETTDRFPWYALQVRSRHEKLAGTILRSKGYDSFVPTYRARRVWSDRIKDVELPVLAGYVLCRLPPSPRLGPILGTLGVVRIIGFGNVPQPLEEYEVEAFQRADGCGLAMEPWPYLKRGTVMRIFCGSLAGLEGIYVRSRNSHRVVVSVTLLQRSVAVEIDPAWLTPVLSGSNAHPILEPEADRAGKSNLSSFASSRR